MFEQILTVHLQGFAIGPIVWGPISELYGRRLPLFFGFAIFAIFQIPVAVAQNVYTIMLCRFFGGMFGSAPLAVVGGALADFWGPVERGFALGLFSGATFIGPVAGPIVGSFVTQSYLGWRWTAWITLFLSAFFGTLSFFICSESYAPVLLQRKAAKIRFETKNWAVRKSFPCMHLSGLMTNLCQMPQWTRTELISMRLSSNISIGPS